MSASSQRYTPVPGRGMGTTSTQQIASPSSYGFDQLSSDSRYPSPRRLSSASSYPYRDDHPPSFPRGTTNSATTTSMPLMSDASPGAPVTFEPGYAHQNIPSEQYYPMSEPVDYAAVTSAQKARKKKRMWIIIGTVFGILAIIGIIVGVVVSQVGGNDDSASDSNSAGASDNSGDDSNPTATATATTTRRPTSTSTTTSVLSNPDDPSDFERDPNLHQSFYAFAYTPNLSQLPWCGVTQANVTRDIQLLSQLTTRIRLYGANCNQTAMVMQAIQDTKVNMTVWLGIYVDSNETAYENQVTAVTEVLQTYGTDHISGITVGNEYILNTAGTDSITDSTYLASVQFITDKIASFNTTIQGLGLNKVLPIGTSDAGSLMSVTLGEGIDYFMANVHPWFGSVGINDAAVWTNNFFQYFDVDVAAEASNNPVTYIAETGWPTASMNASEANSGFAGPQGDASVANLQIFLDTFVCQANNNGTGYFFFEAFDEPWKRVFGGVEPYWGLFDSNRNLKDVTIPTCS